MQDVYPAGLRPFPCDGQPDLLDSMVPISYSEHGGQLHHALWVYKNGAAPNASRYAAIRLAAILWRFLEGHESCIARSAGVDRFDFVCSVPSSSPERDEAHTMLRTMIGWCGPINDRW